MPYIGQDLQVAYPTYKNIDDISGSFNGITTSFALLVGGVAPSPLPLNSQQCLISVGGVIQRPDDTGAEGFRLSGGNIIFSSAPASGEDFFGVILAGADYVNVGANFPDGSVGAPSITFDQNNNTGFYRPSSGQIAFSSNGVNVATFGTNSFTAPSFIPTSSSVPTNGIYLPSANSVAISTNGAQRVTVDSSGRCLVGTATSASGGNPAASKLQVVGNSNSSTGAGIASISRGQAASSIPTNDVVGLLSFADNTGGTYAEILAVADAASGTNDYPGRLVFSTTADGASSPTERMRITAAGSVCINRTSTISGFNSIVAIDYTGASAYGIVLKNTSTTTFSPLVFINSSGSSVGEVQSSTTATSYLTSSDYRLKENVTAVTDGIARLQQLKPSRFNFIADPDVTVDGFIAHEVQDVVPEAIKGEKDAVDDDGNPIYQGIDQSKLVPLLTAALQEAIAKIETLEARLTAAGIA